MKKSFYEYNFDELAEVLKDNDLNPAAAKYLYNWHYKQKRDEQCLENVSLKSQKFLQENMSFELPKISTVLEAEDKTVKFLFELRDGHKVESVLIPFHNKYSVCISSQVGCAMNCAFCFTGTQGFTRNLTTDEIVGQFLEAWRWLAKNRPGEERILNIVFMGQGEPLHNFDHVKKAVEIFVSNYGTSVGYQRITISTAGYIPGLRRWKQEIPGVNLALSLHSPFDTKRDELIPINKKYPLSEVLSYVDDIPLSRKQFVTYEYLLISKFNDSAEDAHRLGKLLEGKRAIINLIPFNEFEGSKYERPALEQVELFKSVLVTYNLPVLIRATKGDDVLAACGQLNTGN